MPINNGRVKLDSPGHFTSSLKCGASDGQGKSSNMLDFVVRITKGNQDHQTSQHELLRGYENHMMQLKTDCLYRQLSVDILNIMVGLMAGYY